MDDIKSLFSSDEKMYGLVQKASMLGMCKPIEVMADDDAYVISISEYEHIIFIPKTITCLNESYKIHKFADAIKNLNGKLTIVNNKLGIQNADYMFYEAKATELDLTYCIFDNLMSAEGIFEASSFKKIDLSNKDFGILRNASGMFEACKAEEIILTNVDFSNLNNASYMFKGVHLKSLDLSTIKWDRVKNFAAMFETAKIHDLKFNFNGFLDDTWMTYMFQDFETDGDLVLDCFADGYIHSVEQMFCGCKANSIIIKSMNMYHALLVDYMFNSCKAKYVSLTDTYLNEKAYPVDMFKYSEFKFTTDDDVFQEVYDRYKDESC